MQDLALDNDGDLALPVRLTTPGVEALRQKLQVRLRLFLGEWVLDALVGLPYYRDLFIKGVTVAALTSLFRRAIASCPGVDALLSLTAKILPDRVATVSFTVRASSGDVVDFVDFAPGLV